MKKCYRYNQAKTHYDTRIPSAIDIQTNSQPIHDICFFKYKTFFQRFFNSDDYSVDLKTLQQQHFQDRVLRTVLLLDNL